ncbi:unnamed protein product [Euphydryas editha]|uniref:DDE Tnp4 domain-containing protein n=1 Tax=Euphydryas editha TaxID=104508 RepID=A0AAU9U4M2_EUPED|nr:unnamed protein product [Euphydryas editha]
MDLFEVLEDELDVYFQRVTRPRRNRVIRPRPNYFDILDDVDFRARFRLTKRTVANILSLIESDIKTTSNYNFAITPMQCLLITLRYFATGTFLTVCGDFGGVSKASARRIIHKVSEAIAKLRPLFVKFPADTNNISQDFYEIARFPRVVGVIDCTHITIKSPGGETAEWYRDRKGNLSMNVQTIVDNRLKIMYIVARWPGSCHDQTIFNNSHIKQRLSDREFGNKYILGDRGYENTNFVLTPLHNPQTPGEHLYNESQIRTRNVVERSYGVLISRFPVLAKKINLHHSKVEAIIVACAVLHNIATDMGEEIFDYDMTENSEVSNISSTSVTNYCISNCIVRNSIINYFFITVIIKKN